MNIPFTSTVQIDASLEDVWDFIAPLDRLCELGLPGYFHRIDVFNVTPGQRFSCHNGKGDEYERTIVAWNHHHVIAIGNPGKSGWEYEFVVNAVANQTTLNFSRVFSYFALPSTYKKEVDKVTRNAKELIRRNP
jgi:hypothetical protein